MGDSTCLMHSLSLASNHGNHVGDSVSFGRFTSESLSWEKWSSFSHKRYVEEAKSYAQPGSVAEKKAFFEAHYKKVAAQKAAAAAAALLEQEKAKSQVEETICDPHHGAHDSEAKMSTVDLVEPQTRKTVVAADMKKDVLNSFEDQVSVSEDSSTSHMERPLLKSKLNTDQEVLQPKIRRKPAIPSFRSPSITKKQSRFPASPRTCLASMHPQKENMVTPRTKNSAAPTSVDKTRSAPRSLHALMNSGSVKESCKVNSPAVLSTPKRCATPTITPFKVKNGENKQPVATPSVKRRMETPVHPSAVRSKTLVHPSAVGSKTPIHLPAVGSKTPVHPSAVGSKTHVYPSAVGSKTPVYPSAVGSKTPIHPPAVGSKTPVHPSAVGSKTPGQKWHIFSSVSKSLSAYKNKLQSPTVSSPFTLRTEERAARRKQKLEEKFNEKAAHKVQMQTTLKEKAETEFRRFRQSFCFKARPLPSFYSERETQESPMKNTPQANQKCVTPARKPESTVSQPSLTKKSTRRLWKTNDQNITHHPLSLLARRINHENACPNIQH